MRDMRDQIRMKWEGLAPTMDERQQRLWLGAEAEALGYGGVTIVTEATGISHKRIVAGKRDLARLRKHPPAESPREQRIRRPGAGRPRSEERDPELVAALDALIDPTTRGDPMSPLRWTCKSTTRLSEELTAAGHPVGRQKVWELLRGLGYSLQSNQKTREGAQHPDRNAQFESISRQARAFQRANEPVVSVDTKKKELIGDFKNGGREWQPSGAPVPVRVHDFKDPALGKAIPYGVYDIFRDEGWMNVGIDHDTAEFAVASIRRWWRRMGARAYPAASKLLITADAGGSNGPRLRVWKTELQKLADETRMEIHVAHYPPGTSKWNKIEHRMFSHITQNWRGRPLETLETIVNLVAATTTSSGLRIRAAADKGKYPGGVEVTDEELKAVRLMPKRLRGNWNYSILPRKRA